MSERALRGTRLGATSYETDSGIEFAPRRDVEYACEHGHRFGLPFSSEADVPATWECRVCGAVALLVDGQAPEEKQAKPARTHWDMLLERRTVSQLEEVLAERLEVLRSGGISAATTAASTKGAQAARRESPSASVHAMTSARKAGAGKPSPARDEASEEPTRRSA
jgi:hypothetical protein